MNCRECELGLEDQNPQVEEHLAGCSACRELAFEMAQNAWAFKEMAFEELPVRRSTRWGWAPAAAAAVVAMVGASVHFKEQKLPIPGGTAAAVPVRQLKMARPDEKVFILPPVAVKPKKKRTEPLMVKMLTDDPDVVIYWEIETKEEMR